MSMEDIYALGPPWIWLGLGLLLAALEMIVPGVYLIWLAVAAIITGIAAFLFIGSVPVQIALFVVLSLAAVYSAKRFLRNSPIPEADPLMNQRGGRMVGEVGVVTDALDGALGRVHLGDSDWSASGPDMLAGTRVKVTGMDGTTLLVEPLAGASGDGEADAPDSSDSGESGD